MFDIWTLDLLILNISFKLEVTILLEIDSFVGVVAAFILQRSIPMRVCF